uniref:Uncharacterized protein n=1 Tax=Meloidogyne hapla TaxID=6305 RepID=A0A1I8BCC2_MELHA
MNELTSHQQNGFSNKQNNNINGHHHVQFVFDDVNRLPLPSNLYMPKNNSEIYQQKQQKTNNTYNNNNHSNIPLPSTSSWQMPLILPSDINNKNNISLQKQLINKTNGQKTKNKKQKREQKENCEKQLTKSIKLKIVLVGSGCVGKSSLTIQVRTLY